MRASTSNYDDANALDSKAPVWLVIFDVDDSTIFSTHTGFDETGKPGGSTIVAYVKNFHVKQADIELGEAHLTSNEGTIELLDVNDEVTAYLNTNFIFGSGVTIKQGFMDIAYSDFVTLWIGEVTKIKVDNALNGWVITARDNIGQLNRPIFRGLAKTFLNGAISGTPATFTLGNAGSFVDPSTLPANARVETAVLIDDEIISYDAINYETNVLTVATAGRGEAHTFQANHDNSADVTQAFVFNEDPLRIWLQVLTTTEGGANGPYDLGIPNFGLGIHTLIDIETIERIGWKLVEQMEWNPTGSAICYIAAWQTEKDALKWAEEWLLKPIGCYPVISSTNRISVQSADYVNLVENFSADAVFTDSKIDDLDFEFRNDEIINQIQLLSGVRSGPGGSQSDDDTLRQADSIAIYGQSQITATIKHPGGEFIKDIATLRSERMLNLFTYRFMLFFDMLISVNFKALYSQSLFEPQDFVTITYPNMPDIVTGARGWSAKKCLLTGQDLIYSRYANNFSARSWEGARYLHTSLAGLYNIEKVAEGAIDDRTVTMDADITTVQTAIGSDDGVFFNDSLMAEADRIVFFVRITPPGSAGSTSETISLQIATAADLAGTPQFIKTEDKPYIRYNPQSDEPFVIELDLICDEESDVPESLQVDWYATSAGAGDEPEVEFVGAWFVLAKARLSV